MVLWSEVEHLVLNGTVEYKNTVGYINAEQMPFMTFFPAMAVLYILMLCFQGWKMQEFKYHLINLHWCVLAVIVINLFDCFTRWGNFMYYNKYGFNSFWMIFFQVFVQVIRDTFSRVITLLVSLGYGILIKSISKYRNKIFVLTVLYMASLALYQAFLHINYFTPLSGIIMLITNLPLAVTDFIFCFWIWMALRRTLNYLVTKEQKYKYAIISRIFICICACIVVTIILQMMQVQVMMTNSRDSDWRSFYVWEVCWFTISTVFVASIVWILQPNESSDLLTQIQEVLDETLTEQTQDAHEAGHEIELEDMESHEFGKFNRLQSLSERLEGVPEDIFYADQVESQPEMSLEEFSEMKR